MRLVLVVPLMYAACDPSSVVIGGDKGNPPTRTETTDTARPDDPPDVDPNTTDDDGDGLSEEDGDCDDSDGDVLPGGDEGDEANGKDEDCSGLADDLDACLDGAPRDLQSAIDDTPEGFTLRVCAGSWTGAFRISRALTLLAVEGPEVTTLEGDGTGPVLTILRVDGEVGVEGFTITGGSAENGGGVLAVRAEVGLRGNVVSGNSASALGGGVYLESCEGEVTGNILQENVAGSGGGLMVWDGRVTVADNTVVRNSSTSVDEEIYGKGAGGGGVFVYGSSDVLNNTIEANDSAYNGGGLYFYQGNGTVDGNQILGNHGVNDGGGVMINYGSQTFTNNVVQDNVCDDDGGGVRVYVGQGVVLTDNQFIGNSTVDDGGGLKLSHSRNTIARNHFEANVAGDAGGGLELDDETTDVEDCTFVGNQAARGAGLHSWQAQARITLERLSFENNVASVCGGAIGIDNDPYTIVFRHVLAVNNSALDGAAVCIDKQYQDDEQVIFEDSSVLFENVIFWKNAASDDGGILYSLNGHTTFRNVTAYDNTGGDYGGFSLEDSSVVFENSILADQDGEVFGGIKEGTVESSASFAYTLLFDNDGGFSGIDDPVGADGNIDDDHRMTDPESGDFTLSVGSPALDAGDPSVRDADGSRSDMGAFGGPAGSW